MDTARAFLLALAVALAACDGSDQPLTGPDASTEAVAVCGNGQVEAGEQCDDGAANSNTEPGACRADCQSARCGDGVLDDGEKCDDGVNDGSYGSCSADCLAEGPRCGDAEVNGAETCDDGVNDGSYGSCSADCLAEGPRCGDGVVSGDEACDDGINDGSYGHCLANCVGYAAYCGDGLQNGTVGQPEVCDDGTNNGSYGKCSVDCSGPGPRCGDGTTNGPEACDDGASNGAYGKCDAACSGLGERCGDGVKNGPEACDDGASNGAYDKCSADCSGPGLYCGDGVENGAEECDDKNADDTDDCKNDCTRPAFTVSYGSLPATDAPLDQRIELFFSRTVDAATLVDANITVKTGGVPVELRFLPAAKSVELLVARWEPNTTYAITVGVGVKDAWGNALPAASTKTFATKSTYADGSSLLMGAPLAMADFQSMETMQSPGAYSPIATPQEYVLLGVDADVNDAISILDHKASNTFHESVPANSVLWNSAMAELRNTPKRGVRARLDDDVRDEVAVVVQPGPDQQLKLMVIDPAPTANNRGTTYSTKVISSAIGPANTLKLFDLAAGQADSDPYEELFVLVGGGYTNDPNNPIDGKLRLYVFDDAAANHALLKSVVLASHAFPITGVSLAVGDVDRDGTDEVAVVYNVNADNDAYGWQDTRATLYRQKEGALEAVEVPLHGVGGWNPSERKQEYNPAQMVKIAVANVDEDPSQRELVVSKLHGGKGYSSTQGIQIFRYAPAGAPSLIRLGNFGLSVSVSTDSFQPHPDKVFLPIEVNEGSQKELLLMDYSIVRFERDPYTQAPKLTTLHDGGGAFDEYSYSVAVGEVEARTFDASGKAEQDHRSDEIVLLASDGMRVFAIDELRDGDGSITGYQPREVGGVPAIQPSGVLDGALLVLADVDHDGIYGKFVSRTTKLSENHIIALIAAPPCHAQMEGCSSEIAFGEAHSGSNEVSGTASVSASAGFHLLADAAAGLVVSAAVTIEEIDIDISIKATAGFAYTYTKEYTKTITYGTTKEHMVVFSTTPYEMYNYKLVAHPILDSIKPGNDSFFIAVPNPPAIYTMSKPVYDKQAAAEADKVKGILASTPGVLTSYEAISSYDAWKKDKDVKVVDISPGDQVITTPKAATYGELTSGIELGVSTTYEFRGSLFVEAEAELRVCTAAVCIGGAVGLGAGYAFSYSFTDSVSFSGTVGNVLANEPTYQFLMTPHRVRRQQTINDKAVTQDFLVLDYLVKPPAL